MKILYGLMHTGNVSLFFLTQDGGSPYAQSCLVSRAGDQAHDGGSRWRAGTPGAGCLGQGHGVRDREAELVSLNRERTWP